MSREEYYARIEARKQKYLDLRADAKKRWAPEIDRLLNKLRALLPECGLTEFQISICSGAVRSSIKRILRPRFKSARFDTVVRLLGTAGYRFEIVPMDPHDDGCRDMRRFKPPPLED